MDFIHISCWDCSWGSSEFKDDDRTLTQWFSERLDNAVPIISAGGIWSTAQARSVMGHGADMVAVARAGHRARRLGLSHIGRNVRSSIPVLKRAPGKTGPQSDVYPVYERLGWFCLLAVLLMYRLPRGHAMPEASRSDDLDAMRQLAHTLQGLL